MFKGKPKIYFGDGGFSGMSEQHRSREVSRPSVVKKSPSVYMGGGMSGVSTRKVLGVGGIARVGEVVQVKAKAEKAKPVIAAVTSPKVEKKLEECVPPMDERGNGCNEKITEKEDRLADFLEAAQEAKAKCEEADAPPDPPATVEPPVEATGVGERREEEEVGYGKAVLPELPLGGSEPFEGGKRKRKRRRKRQRADASLNFE